MKDYVNYMNRQKLSETGMERLLKLEKERPERAKRVPQWVKYCAMAASLVLVVGLFALAVLQGDPGQADPRPLVTPTVLSDDKLYFNVLEETPINATVPEGIDMKDMTLDDIMMILGLSEDTLPDLGWEDFTLTGTAVSTGRDPDTGLPTHYFTVRGSSTAEAGVEFALFLMPNMTDFEGHEDWKELPATTVNGHTVTAAYCYKAQPVWSSYHLGDCHAAALFSVSDVPCDYGVFFEAHTWDEIAAKEMTTKLVRQLTQDGVFTERYDGLRDDGPFAKFYDTLEETRGAVPTKFLPYLPTEIPDHDDFSGSWRYSTGEYELARVDWHKYATKDRRAHWAYLTVEWPEGDGGTEQAVDVTDRESYDFRFHEWLVFPDEPWKKYTGIYAELDDPIFRAEDISPDVIEGRIYREDNASTWCKFRLLHDNGVVVRYQTANLTAAEIWELVQDTMPNGVAGETYGFPYDGWEYPELTGTPLEGGGMTVGSTRPLTREELEHLCPITAEETDYLWYATAYYYPDGGLGTVAIAGTALGDRESRIEITVGMEQQEVFLNNRVRGEDGEPFYFGAEYPGPEGVEEIRCYRRYVPNYMWDSETGEGAEFFSSQFKGEESLSSVEISTAVKDATPEENRAFNQEWTRKMMDKGIWASTGVQNGKPFWNLPETGQTAEPSGTYHLESEDGGALKVPRLSFDKSAGTCAYFCKSRPGQIGCTGNVTVEDGQVKIDCGDHYYVLEIVDDETLRFLGTASSRKAHYDGLSGEVPDGAVFRRLKNGETTVER